MNTQIHQVSKIRAWAVCLSAALFFAYELMQLHMFNAISPMLMKDLNMNAAAFGTLSSTYLLADVIFLLPAGIILDKVSVRKVILAALFICIVGTLGFSKAQNFSSAAICHFLSGIGNAFCFLSCMMFISRWFPEKKQALVVGVVVTIGMLGGVLAQTPFSKLVEITSGWREAMLFDAVFGVVIFFIIYFVAKDAPKPLEKRSETTPGSFLQDIKASLVSKTNILCGIYTGLMNLPLMVIGAVYGSLFLSQIHKVTLNDSTKIASMICMGTIVGSSLFGYISDKMEKRKPLMLFGAAAACAIMLMIMFLEKPNFFVLVFLFFMLGFFSSTQVLGYPIITEKAPKHLTGTSMGVAAVIIMGVAAIAQPLTGKLMDFMWDQKLINGLPIYPLKSYLLAFSIFPVSFMISLASAYILKEKPKVKANRVNV